MPEISEATNETHLLARQIARVAQMLACSADANLSVSRDELFCILNRLRGVAEAAPPRATTPEPTKVHGVTWLVLRDGCVVLERCEKKAAVLGVGEWFVPGGKIDGDESSIACCQREMREEWPGVEVLTMNPLPIVEGSAVPPGPRGVFLMRPFVVTVRGEVPSESGDGVPLRWVPIAEALASPVPQVRMMVAAAVSPSRASGAPDGTSGIDREVAPLRSANQPQEPNLK